MPPPSSRMTKNRQQPTRYRPGKAETEDYASEDESDESDEAEQAPSKAVAPPKATSFPAKKKLAVDLSKAGQQTSVASQLPKVQRQQDDLEGFVTASESSEEEGEDGNSEEDEDESGSSEEEESSDDEPQKPLLRPTFISKAKRAQQTSVQPAVDYEQQAAEEELRRKEKADEMLQAQLEREAALRAAGQRAWDDDGEAGPEEEVDDTDGLDAEAEKAAWKLRELKRVRRERLAIEEKEKEREEIERRRNMTAEEREAEDKVFIDAQKEEREGRGKMGFMQKYFHKGAFFGDDDEQDEEVKAVMNRDLAGARYEDDTGDKSILPEYMRIRDMTRLGKKGRTRYKDLKAEDTGRWGTDLGRKRRDEDGLDDRFKSDDWRSGGQERTGANNAPVGERRRRVDEGNDERGEKRARLD